MPNQINHHEFTSDRRDDGPEWSPNGVELHISEADREMLQDYGIQLMLTSVEEVLATIAAMRRREAPESPNPQRALSAVTHLSHWAKALERELLSSGWLTHGQAATAMGVARSTAQRARESAEASTDRWEYRGDVGHRPEAVPARDWYRPNGAEAAPAPLSVIVPGGDLPVKVTTNEDGRRAVTTQARVLIVNGERLVIRPGQTRDAQGFRWYGSNEGIEGYEQ